MRVKLSESIAADLRRGASEFEMLLKYGAVWVYNRGRYLEEYVHRKDIKDFQEERECE